MIGHTRKLKSALQLFFCLLVYANDSLADVAISNSEIPYDKALIIVHPFSDWDMENAAKPAVDNLVRFHKKLGQATIYVLDGNGSKGLYLEDAKPTLFVDAPTGQFFNVLLGETFLFAGGSWSYCLSNSMTSAIANTTALNIKFTVFTDASFEFMQKENMAEYLDALTPELRKEILLAQFEGIAKRAAGSEICLEIYYGGNNLGTTSGVCSRKGKVYLEQFVRE